VSAFRPTVLTSSLQTIESNLRLAMAACDQNVKAIAVVKADAYGHGMIPVGKRLLKAGAWGLAVATVDEAIELREAGIDNPVLVLGGTCREALEEAVLRHISLAVYDEETLKNLQRTAALKNETARAHMKIDTGMARIGARGDHEINALLDVWQKCPDVSMEGCFTHFAKADDAGYSRLQKERFDRALSLIRGRGYHPQCHAAASEAMALGRDYWYDAVRPGIVMYGASLQKLFPGIEPAQTLSTRPVRLEWIEPGDSVGYGCTFTASRKTRVMTVPIGYGDGYPRVLSSKADVLVNGRRAKVIGRVCMDQMMVDVTDVPDVTMDSDVVLLGRQGKERITPDELAALAGTIPYEIMLGFSKRVTRRVVD